MLELAMIIVCNAGILAIMILGIIGALSPNGQQQQDTRKRKP